MIKIKISIIFLLLFNILIKDTLTQYQNNKPFGFPRVENFHPPEGYQPVKGFEPNNYQPNRNLFNINQDNTRQWSLNRQSQDTNVINTQPAYKPLQPFNYPQNNFGQINQNQLPSDNGLNSFPALNNNNNFQPLNFQPQNGLTNNNQNLNNNQFNQNLNTNQQVQNFNNNNNQFNQNFNNNQQTQAFNNNQFNQNLNTNQQTQNFNNNQFNQNLNNNQQTPNFNNNNNQFNLNNNNQQQVQNFQNNNQFQAIPSNPNPFVNQNSNWQFNQFTTQNTPYIPPKIVPVLPVLQNNTNELEPNWRRTPAPNKIFTTSVWKENPTTPKPTTIDYKELFVNSHTTSQNTFKNNQNSQQNNNNGGVFHIDDQCLKCLCFIESWCTDVGCVWDQGSLSCGWYQLKYEYWLDCGQPGGGWKECANNKQCAEGCVRGYMTRYGSFCSTGTTCPHLGRIHNGGPYGCSSNSTEYYGWLIARCLKREAPYENIDTFTVPH